MKVKRQRLRLRKQVVVCLPILLLITALSIFLNLNKKISYANEVTPREVAVSPNDIAASEIGNGKLLSEFKPIINLQKAMEMRQKDNTIIYYANAFKLNLDITLQMVHEFTQNYTNELFLNTNVIGPESIIYANGSFNSFEAGVAYFTRDLYRYPEKYGKTIEEVRLDETPTIKEVNEDGNIYMDNGLTFEQYMGKISNLFGMDPSFTLAICYQESGIKTSGLFTKYNNIGGHKGYDGWMSFPTLEAGVIAHVLAIRSIYSRFEIDVNDSYSDATFSGVYVNGVYGSIAYDWLNKVTYFKEKINEKDLFSTIK